MRSDHLPDIAAPGVKHQSRGLERARLTLLLRERRQQPCRGDSGRRNRAQKGRYGIGSELADGRHGGAAHAQRPRAATAVHHAKQTLANGYRGLPLQQSCLHPNACLTCDSFTTSAFLPQPCDQLTRTEQLIPDAGVSGRSRLVD
jgi:hypothetical protein